MCGIFNVISKNNSPLDMAMCRRSLSELTWRGPNLYIHSEYDDRVFFGQTVLSVVGSSHENSGEYLCSQSNRFLLGFNGEIYNYKELESRYLRNNDIKIRRGIDSEVLVNLHDVLDIEQVPYHLDGMYAYTVLDQYSKTITIVCDPQGEKTLYLFENDEILIISSEVAPILSMISSIKLNRQILCDYFFTRHLMLTDDTMYEGITKLVPGEIKSFNLSSGKWGKTYYQKSSDWVDSEISDLLKNQTTGELTSKLHNVFEECLDDMVPSRHYASVISGGVDSSLITGLLVKNHNPDILIAVNHEGKDNISNNLVSFEKSLGRDISVLNVDMETYSAEIVNCQKTCGSPLFAHSLVGQSLQSGFVRANGGKVIFGGEGADELFGGYAAYLDIANKNITRYECSPSPYMQYSVPPLEFIDYDSSILHQKLKELWQDALAVYQHVENMSERILQAMMYCDFKTQLSSVGLRGSDLMSMMKSVENRSMFLRKPVVQIALNLPIWAKINQDSVDPHMASKPLLKEIFKQIYPEELLFNKQGFAGFPNESIKYLGDMRDFLVFEYLGINKNKLDLVNIDRATAWKLINIEYFLRHQGGK